MMKSIFFAAILMLAASPALAGSDVFVGDPSPSAPVSMDQVDHSPWDELVGRYVNDRGQVDYRGWKASAKDRASLQDYLKRLSGASTRLPAQRSAILAFWINAYNAVTVEGILREYPTSSIRNHTAKLFGYNIWDDLKLYVGGKAYSLNQIEHDVLRKMGEPRIHFAIVCASKGCPRLLDQAYTAAQVDAQLTLNAKHFFAQSANFSVSGSTVQMSSILDWFGEDFGKDKAAVLARIAPWLPAEVASKLVGKPVQIKYASYDWSINEQ